MDNGITYAKTKERVYIAIPLRTSLKSANYEKVFLENGLNTYNCLPIFNNYYDYAKKMEKQGLMPIFVFEKKYEKDVKYNYYIMSKDNLEKGIKNKNKGFLKSPCTSVYAHISTKNCMYMDMEDINQKTLINKLFGR